MTLTLRMCILKIKLEDILQRALERMDNDRFKLSCFVFARIKELGEGATPLVNMDVTKYKLVDIALCEVAENKIAIDRMDVIE